MRNLNDPAILKAFYPLSKDTKDYSGNGNDGSNNGVTFTEGAFGKDVGNFDGSSDYVNIGNIIPDNSVTVTAWVKPDSLGSNNSFLGVRELDGDYFWLQFNSAGKLRIFVAPGGTISTVDGDSISVDNWNFVSFVITPTNLTRYLNGNQTGTINSGEYDLSRVIGDIYLGGRNDIPGRDVDNLLNGKISNVRIYNVALTNTEIKQLYNQEQRVSKSVPVSKPISQSSPIIKDGLVGAWGFKNPSIQGEDFSGQGNNGTLEGDAKLDKNGRFVFDGVNDYVYLGNARSDTQGTAIAWIKTDYVGTQYVLGSGDEASTDYTLGLLRVDNTGEISVYANNDDGGSITKGTTIINDGKWHHVAISSNGSEYEIYVDGSEETIQVESGSNDGRWFADISNLDNLTIGALKRTSVGAYFNGSIGEVAIYNRSLSDDEIKLIYKTGVPDSNLVLEVNGDGVDRSPNENEVVLNNGTKYGKHLEFDGVNDYVDCGDIKEIDGSDELTVSAWVKNYDLSTDGAVIGRWGNIEGNQFLLYLDTDDAGDGYRFLVTDSEDISNSTSSDSINAVENVWQHVVGVYNSSGIYLYVDGEIVDTGSSAGNPVASVNYNVGLGSNNGDESARQFNGKMDKVKVYSKALSSQEVKDLYDKEKYNF